MASNITFETIDDTYPVAGVDNDTQGFRDNFNIIKNALGTAKEEITEIQAATTQQFFSISEGETAGEESITISVSNGGYQTVIIGQDTDFTLGGWPESGVLSKITVEVLGDSNDTYEITWGSTVEGGGEGRILTAVGSDASTNDYVSVTNNPKIFEFWSHDGGLVIYARFLGEFTEEL